jgi:secreted trypsin-like serine protease
LVVEYQTKVSKTSNPYARKSTSQQFSIPCMKSSDKYKALLKIHEIICSQILGDIYMPNVDEGTCGNIPERHKRTIGGTTATKEKFPFVAGLGLMINGKLTITCTGALISRRYVLTAAHCFGTYGTQTVTDIFLGDWHLENGLNSQSKTIQRFEINSKDVTVHQNSDSKSLEDDLALIRLPRNVVTYNEDHDQIVLPVCLDWDNKIPDIEKSSLFAIGRGSNETTQFQLRKVDLPFVPLNECNSRYQSIFNKGLTEKQFCAGGVKGM